MDPHGRHLLCEYPVGASPLAATLTHEPLPVDGDGLIHVPDGPGLGMTLNLTTIRQYLQPVEIRVAGRVIYSTPDI